MYRYESWTIKETECCRIDAFKLWSWRRLVRVPWTARRSKTVNAKENQPWVFIGRTDTEVEALTLWLPDERANSLVKTRRPGEIECRRRRGWHRIRWLDSIIDSTWTPRASGGQRSLNYYSPWGHKQLGMTYWLNNNTCYDIFVVFVIFSFFIGILDPIFLFWGVLNHPYRFLHLFSHFVTSYAYIWRDFPGGSDG